MRLNCASLFVTLNPFLTCLYEMKGAKMEGWLHIRKNHGKLLDVGGVVGGSNGLATYKKRFVRLSGFVLTISNGPKDEPNQTFALTAASRLTRKVTEHLGRGSASAVTCPSATSSSSSSSSRKQQQKKKTKPGGLFIFDVETGGSSQTTYAASSPEDREKWLAALLKVVQHAHLVMRTRIQAVAARRDRLMMAIDTTTNSSNSGSSSDSSGNLAAAASAQLRAQQNLELEESLLVRRAQENSGNDVSSAEKSGDSAIVTLCMLLFC